MEAFLKSGQVGNITLNEQRKINEAIQSKWSSFGFTDGLDGLLKENIAILYENEAKALISEATDAANSGQFQTVIFPIVRRTFSKLLANDIVSVQAMSLPVGQLFYFLPVTSEREWSVPTEADAAAAAEGDIIDGMTGSHKGLMGYDRANKNKNGSIEPRYYLPDEAITELDKDKWYVPDLNETVTNATDYQAAVTRALASGLTAAYVRQDGPDVTKYFQKSLYDLFYDDGLFDNSKGKVTIKVGQSEIVKLTPKGFTELGEGEAPAISGYDGTVRNITLKVKGFNSFNAGKLTGPDGNEMDTEEFLSSLKVITTKAISGAPINEQNSGVTTAAFAKYEGLDFRVATQKYGRGIVDYANPCSADGSLYIEVNLYKPVAQQAGTIDGYVGIQASQVTANMFKIAWSQYDSLELETELGEVSFNLTKTTVSVVERKLRTTWSPEMAQDVSAFHNIDAEAELTQLLSEQIAGEVDREILRDLRRFAPWKLKWDVNGWRRQAAFSTNYTQKDWNQTLLTKVNQIDGQIVKASLQGGANFIVVSAEISALLNDLEYFHVSDASAESDHYSMGIEKIGAINGKIQVFRDPLAPSWSLIMGHKGNSMLDTGYIYAPYIPIQLTPTFINTNNFAPVKGVITRYAKKVVNSRFYGAIVVDGLQTWSVNELR